MVRLETMGEELFESYMKGSIASYAEANVKAGHWVEAEAEQKAKEQFQHILSQGQKTEGHNFFMVIDESNNQKVGVVWAANTETGGEQVSFLYDIIVDEPFRRQGYGKQAMRALEIKAAELGSSAVWLHVFAENEGAKNLYDQLGYKVMITHLNEKSGVTMSFHMAKSIVADS
ncbi:MAG: GNAT family N-acetyltransferase [Anaerolineaceae bacterium]|nr:GNAT family N-acetyltransferase [Anaerolineaceae bacterium]